MIKFGNQILCSCRGGFMIIRDSNGTAEVIDFRETAPAAANKTMFKDKPMLAKYGGLSVGIP
jgi:gamma-glutamyltranspeptidase